MKEIFSQLRKCGISSFFYIDDSLLQEQSYQKCFDKTVILRNFLDSSGFKVNEEKSVFIPTQRIVFLGYIIDSVEFKVFSPKEKIEKIIKFSRKISDAKDVCI